MSTDYRHHCVKGMQEGYQNTQTEPTSELHRLAAKSSTAHLSLEYAVPGKLKLREGLKGHWIKEKLQEVVSSVDLVTGD
jgi:hypothetical protein